MGFEPNAEGLVALSSALPLVILGIVLLWLRPRRAENVYFALFSALWGVQVATANLSRLTEDPGLSRLLFIVTVVVPVPTAFFLAYFASLHPTRNALARSAWGPWLLALAFVPSLLVLLLRPEWVLAETVSAGGVPVTRYGPAAIPLFAAPFFLAFYYALTTQFMAARNDHAGVAGRRARAVFLALALFVSYHTTRQALNWLLPAGHFAVQDPAIRIANAVLFGGGVLLILVLLGFALARPPKPGDVDLVMVAALAVPAVVAGVERSLVGWFEEPETTGFWRIGAVALVVVAVAHYQLFDLDLRLRRLTARALPWSVAGVTLIVLASLYVGGSPLWLVGGVAFVGVSGNAAVLRYRAPLNQWLIPAGLTDPDYLYHRRLQVYQGHLERLVADDAAVNADDARLRTLRRSLGISEREHQVLEYVVRRELGTRGVPPNAPPRVEPGAHVLERYRVDRLLGEGSHGRAYLAHDERTDAPVVLKTVGRQVLSGRAAHLLLREARMVASLRHPNVIQVHEVAETADEAFIVMEYADGGSLFGLLQRRNRLPVEEAAAFLDQILAALEAAHAKGIVHRDLKPENVLLTRNGVAKLADFGVARENRPDATMGATQAGPVGTLLYMSPEQVRGRPVDARSDLYAAGVVFHQLVSGRFYLRVAGRDDFQIRQLILRAAPRPALEDEPEWLHRFLQRALAKDPERRFQNAEEMRRALHRRAA